MNPNDAEYFLFGQALHELQRARTKFPEQDVWKTLSALTEEIGELNQAILQYHDEPHKGVTLMNIKLELVQSIVMLLRVGFDGGLILPTEDIR